MYKKCFHKKVYVYFTKRLADYYVNKHVVANCDIVTSSMPVVENGLVSSKHDEIINCKLGRHPSSTPDKKAARLLLENMTKYTERERERDGHE